ncbi:MATE family efflux transporter [Massiliimalia massiliensis]|uniref:MATE family efflux transporter n=1 Tax=Massiliimalia massiliensis TaxID=1852384 RepID=UPI000984A029|nr:MATE family efflux transporter [Massiliimalia massiliensis]
MSENTQTAPIQENKMGVMPIRRLLITMSLPMMVSMLIQALYNIVDSAFVAQISENALTAVSLAFPVQNLMIAVASGTSVGVNALLSRSLGEKNYQKVNLSATNGLFLAVLGYIVFAVLGFFFSEFFFHTQTNDPEIVRYGTDYLLICTVASIGVFLQVMLERLLLSTGKTIFVMITQGIGAIINIIFDPILIFGLFGFPELGVKGAAIATVAGQIVAAALGLLFNHFCNHEISLSFRGFKPDLKTIGTIYSVGLPSIIMMSVGSVMTYGMNKILLMFSSTAVSVFGVYFKLQSFIFMPVFGLNNGMVPIVAYNYGAKNPKRMTGTIRLSIIYAFVLMCIGVLLFECFPAQLLSIFNASDYMLQIGVPALRIIAIHFPVAAFCIIVGSVFQALGNGIFSLIISLCRQLGALLPSAYLLAVCFGLDAVWFAFLIAELVSLLCSSLFFRRIYRTKIHPLYDKTEASKPAPSDNVVTEGTVD